MKSVLILAALAAFIAVCSDASVLKPQLRANFSVGNITAGDRLLLRQYVYKNGIPNAIQYEDVIYRGNATTRVSAVRATEQGATQYSNAYIIGGGIGMSNVTMRVQSIRNFGYYYLIDIYGR